METYLDISKTKNEIIEWLDTYLSNSGLKGFVVGVSGGIDSAVVSTLCALTNKKTIIVNLPIHQAQDQVDRGLNHIDWLKTNFTNVISYNINLTETFESFKKLFSDENSSLLAYANSRSRLRMTALYQIAAAQNCLVVGTGNKVEDFGVGFFTKYGDGGVDISPIADLYKSQVRELGKLLNVSAEIINATPTDGLWDDGRSDEDQIGATYNELEWAMKYVDEGKTHDVNARQKQVIKLFLEYRHKNRHKMVSIPIFKVA